jgi:hypothetical protein
VRSTARRGASLPASVNFRALFALRHRTPYRSRAAARRNDHVLQQCLKHGAQRRSAHAHLHRSKALLTRARSHRQASPSLCPASPPASSRTKPATPSTRA